MRFDLFQCETCKEMLTLPDNGRYTMHPDWVTITQKDNPLQHFCSDTCLNIWLQHRLSGTSAEELQPQEQDEYINVMCKPLGDGTLQSLVSGTIYQPVDKQEPYDQQACKARRFLLYDDQANPREGVQWQDGSVSLEDGNLDYGSWSELQAEQTGGGVGWVDPLLRQEVSE